MNENISVDANPLPGPPSPVIRSSRAPVVGGAGVEVLEEEYVYPQLRSAQDGAGTTQFLDMDDDAIYTLLLDRNIGIADLLCLQRTCKRLHSIIKNRNLLEIKRDKELYIDSPLTLKDRAFKDKYENYIKPWMQKINNGVFVQQMETYKNYEKFPVILDFNIAQRHAISTQLRMVETGITDRVIPDRRREIVLCSVLSPDGNFLFIGLSPNGRYLLYNLYAPEQESIINFDCPLENVTQYEPIFSADCQHLAVNKRIRGGDSRADYYWRNVQGEWEINEDVSDIAKAINFDPCTRYMVVILNQGNSLNIYKLDNQVQMESAVSFNYVVTGFPLVPRFRATFSTCGCHLIVWDSGRGFNYFQRNPVLDIWSDQTTSLFPSFPLFRGAHYYDDVVLSESGRCLAIAHRVNGPHYFEDTVRSKVYTFCLDPEGRCTNRKRIREDGNQSYARTLKISKDGNDLIIRFGRIRVYSRDADGHWVRSLRYDFMIPTTSSLTPDGKYLVISTAAKTIFYTKTQCQWNINCTIREAFIPINKSITTTVSSLNSQLIAIGFNYGDVKVCGLNARRQWVAKARINMGENCYFEKLSLSPTGRHLSISSSDIEENVFEVVPIVPVARPLDTNTICCPPITMCLNWMKQMICSAVFFILVSISNLYRMSGFASCPLIARARAVDVVI